MRLVYKIFMGTERVVILTALLQWWEQVGINVVGYRAMAEAETEAKEVEGGGGG